MAEASGLSVGSYEPCNHSGFGFFAPWSLEGVARECHTMTERRRGTLAHEHGRLQNTSQGTLETGRNVESEGHWLGLGWVEDVRIGVDDLQGVKVALDRALHRRERLGLRAWRADPLARGLLSARAKSELLAFFSKVSKGVNDGIGRIDVVGVEGPFSGILAGRTASGSQGDGIVDGIVDVVRLDGKRSLGPGHGDCWSWWVLRSS
jgi:hypothetical protein